MSLPEFLRQAILGATFLMLGSATWLTGFVLRQFLRTRQTLWRGLAMVGLSVGVLIALTVWFAVRPVTQGLPPRPEVWAFLVALLVFVLGTVDTFRGIRKLNKEEE